MMKVNGFAKAEEQVRPVIENERPCSHRITVIAAGQQFDKKDGKMLPVEASSWAKDIIQEDELQAATE